MIECKVLGTMLQQEREKNQNAAKEISAWIFELSRNPCKLGPYEREYVLDHLVKIWQAVIGDIPVWKIIKNNQNQQRDKV